MRPIEQQKTRISRIGLAMACALPLLQAPTATAQPTNISIWEDIKDNADLSGSFDAIGKAWDTNDQGAVFGATLMTAYTTLLDAKVPGLGSAIRDKMTGWMFPEKDPFAELEIRLLSAISEAEGNILEALNDVWQKVHQDHSEMYTATFIAAQDDLVDVMSLPRWRRVDSATRVKLDRVVNDLNQVRLWLQLQDGPRDYVENLHTYLLVVQALIQAKSEAITLDYFGDRYDMEAAPQQGFDEWVATLDSSAAEAASNDVESSLALMLRSGPASVSSYLLDGQAQIRNAIQTLRDERFRAAGNTPGYTEFWYQLDTFTDNDCWDYPTPTGCHYIRENSEACGDFGYCAEEPQDILDLRQWFAYGEMLMEVWGPARVALDDFWAQSGASNFRSRGPLDRDMDDFMYGRTSLSQSLTSGFIEVDDLAYVVFYLDSFASNVTEAERSYILGRGLRKGEDGYQFIGNSFAALSLDTMRSDLPTGAEWAHILTRNDSVEEVEDYFLGQMTAKIMSVL